MITRKDALRTFYYKLLYEDILKCATFGPGLQVKCKLRIEGPGSVVVGSNCVFEPDPWKQDYVTIYTHRPRARVVIGNNVILRATRFGCHLSIIIGDNAVLENASIFDSDFHNVDATKRDMDFNEGDRHVVIGEGSYVGCESLCSKGVILGRGVIMLAGSVAGTRTIAAGSLVGGYPAKIISRPQITESR